VHALLWLLFGAYLVKSVSVIDDQTRRCGWLVDRTRSHAAMLGRDCSLEGSG
jgi:hypothetical protein